MSDRKPLVIAPDPDAIDAGPIIQQLQGGDDLDIPLVQRVAQLESMLRVLVVHLAGIGIDIPSHILEGVSP